MLDENMIHARCCMTSTSTSITAGVEDQGQERRGWQLHMYVPILYQQLRSLTSLLLSLAFGNIPRRIPSSTTHCLHHHTHHFPALRRHDSRRHTTCPHAVQTEGFDRLLHAAGVASGWTTGCCISRSLEQMNGVAAAGRR